MQRNIKGSVTSRNEYVTKDKIAGSKKLKN